MGLPWLSSIKGLPKCNSFKILYFTSYHLCEAHTSFAEKETLSKLEILSYLKAGLHPQRYLTNTSMGRKEGSYPYALYSHHVGDMNNNTCLCSDLCHHVHHI